MAAPFAPFALTKRGKEKTLNASHAGIQVQSCGAEQKNGMQRNGERKLERAIKLIERGVGHEEASYLCSSLL